MNDQEKTRQRQKDYYYSHPERLQYLKEWQKKKRATNPTFKINDKTRCLMYQGLKNGFEGPKWNEHFDYTLEELKDHLQQQFKKGMSWKNYGIVWSLDHIKPKSSFHIESIKDREYNECWSLDNLQPLYKQENHIKGRKIAA